MDTLTDQQQDHLEREATEKKHQDILKKMSVMYDQRLDDEMGKLHNQFVGFISVANIPIPQVLLVLEILKKETLEQAYKRYLGEA